MASDSSRTVQRTKALFSNQLGVTGLRTLPHVGVNYYARTPRPDPFATVWLPVNASNRIVKDVRQDIMHHFYSRHLEKQRLKDSAGEVNNKPFRINADFKLPDINSELKASKKQKEKETLPPDSVRAAMWMTDANSLAPFASLGKPTCGYFFSRTTDNKKRLTGIPPTNTVKWRSQHTPDTP